MKGNTGIPIDGGISGMSSSSSTILEEGTNVAVSLTVFLITDEGNEQTIAIL